MNKILLVEDSKDLTDNLGDLFSEHNLEFVVAGSAEEGLELLENVFPALVICDYKLPKLSGYEFLLKLKNDKKFAHIPFIMLSAMTEETIVKKSIEGGACAFIKKPFRYNILLEEIFKQLKLAA